MKIKATWFNKGQCGKAWPVGIMTKHKLTPEKWKEFKPCDFPGIENYMWLMR